MEMDTKEMKAHKAHAILAPLHASMGKEAFAGMMKGIMLCNADPEMWYALIRAIEADEPDEIKGGITFLQRDADGLSFEARKVWDG